MRRLALVLLVLELSLAQVGRAQMWPGWQAHTSFREARTLAEAGGALWVGTTGGIFRYTFDEEAFARYTPVEGLHSVDVQVIVSDPRRNCLWVGYADGVLDRLDMETGDVRTFLDIARARQFTNRMIYNLTVVGDSLYVNTGFGVVIFDPVREEVRDSYTQFASLGSALATYDVLPLEDTLWVATDRGLIRAPLHHPNLREPSAWVLEEGLPSGWSVRRLGYFQGTLYAGTERDAYRRRGSGTWERLYVSGREIRAMAVSETYMVIMDRFSIWIRTATEPFHRVVDTTLVDLRDVWIQEETDALWVADGGRGVHRFDHIGQRSGFVSADGRVLPEGPYHNLMSDLEVDAQGVLWAGGVRGTGTGFYRFDGQQWTNYVSALYPELAGRSTFDRIHADARGNVWAGSEGHGLARVTPEGELIIYDHTNSTLRPAAGTASYIRIGGIASEPDGHVWVTNQFASPRLNLFTPEETWVGLPDLSGGGLGGLVLYDRIYVDSYRQKWILLRQGQGLVVLDTGDDPASTADDRFRHIVGRGSGGQGLPGEDVRAWVEDTNGRVWIGTNRGMAFFFAPSLVLSGDPGVALPQWPIAEDGTGYFLRDLALNDMAVDPAGRLWLASEDGAWLVEVGPEGGRVVEHFTTENSPLFSDEVRAVAVNPRDGKVYMATAKGLLSWQGEATAPVSRVEPLFIYPNPVRMNPDGTLPDIFIDRLVAATSLRILTVDGRLVRRFETRGGRIRWDGRDEQGNLVPSGVYMVVAVGREGEGTAYGRVAIIR